MIIIEQWSTLRNTWVSDIKVTWMEYQAMSKYRINEGKTWRAVL